MRKPSCAARVATQNSPSPAVVTSNPDGSQTISSPTAPAWYAQISPDGKTLTYSDTSKGVTQTAAITDQQYNGKPVIEVTNQTPVNGIPVATTTAYDSGTGTRLTNPAVVAPSTGISSLTSAAGSGGTGTATGGNGTGTTGTGTSFGVGGGNCGGVGQLPCTVNVNDSGFSGASVNTSAPSAALDGRAAGYNNLVGSGTGAHGIGYSQIFGDLRFGVPKECDKLDLNFKMGSNDAGIDLSFDPCESPLIQLFRQVEAWLLYVLTALYCWRRFLSSEIPVGA